MARRVVQHDQRSDVAATIASVCGYYLIVDGTKFTEAEGQKEIEEAVSAADFLANIAATIPVVGIYGIMLRIAVKYAATTSALIAPIVLFLLKKHQIKTIRL